MVADRTAVATVESVGKEVISDGDDQRPDILAPWIMTLEDIIETWFGLK
jgi:hypothetical protein